MPVNQESNHARSPTINPKPIRHPGASEELPFLPVLVLLSLFGESSINKPIERAAAPNNICKNICIIKNSIFIIKYAYLIHCYVLLHSN